MPSRHEEQRARLTLALAGAVSAAEAAASAAALLLLALGDDAGLEHVEAVQEALGGLRLRIDDGVRRAGKVLGIEDDEPPAPYRPGF